MIDWKQKSVVATLITDHRNTYLLFTWQTADCWTQLLSADRFSSPIGRDRISAGLWLVSSADNVMIRDPGFDYFILILDFS